MDIDTSRTRAHSSADRLEPGATEGPRPAAPRTAAGTGVDHAAVARPAQADHWLAAFAINASTAAAVTATATTPPSPAQERMDAYRDAFSGPYRIDGQLVKATPQFRMVGGFNDKAAGYETGEKLSDKNPATAELYAICRRAGISPNHCLMGGPTARELTRVTQALIDAGKLPPGPGSLESRVKTMQWQFGIGIQCADYVLGASLAAAHKTPAQVTITSRYGTIPSPASDYFASAATNPNLARVSAANARPGDVFCLDSPPAANGRREVGHRAVVHSHDVADAAKLASLEQAHGAAFARFAEGGPVHVYEMDASWGAGPWGSTSGGVRRDTWLYNPSTKAWAQIQNVAPRSFQLTPHGPYDHDLTGVYRFR